MQSSEFSEAEHKTLSIILPAHNEEKVIRATYRRVVETSERLKPLGLNVEIIFINDGSVDATGSIIDDFADNDKRVYAVHLTRNFGHQAAVSAGLELANGDVISVMDCDLQDPPEILPEFVKKWQSGYQVVYAVREKRKEHVFKRLAYWIFYRVLRVMSEIEIPLDSGDFCVLDRSAVDLLNQLPERQRFIRGLRAWIGLKQVGVRYERQERHAGESSYNFKSLIKLATDGLTSFSSAPLRIATRVGLLGVCFGTLIGIWVVGATIWESINGGHTPRGWASIATLVLLSGSIQLLFLGIFGEYLGRIFIEVKQRPAFLIARTHRLK